MGCNSNFCRLVTVKISYLTFGGKLKVGSFSSKSEIELTIFRKYHLKKQLFLNDDRFLFQVVFVLKL